MANKQKILIIEDELSLLGAIQKKLEIEGYEVAAAFDGEEGLQKLKETKPDLILLDILMPKVDGFGVLEEVHKDPELSKIPIIIISNSGQPVEIEKALELGVKDYLVKAEFDPEEVLVKVNNILKLNNGDETTSKQTKTGKKVLIIEDDQLLLSLSATKLQKEGFEIDVAMEGKQGLEKVAKFKPDIILLDLVLPGIDGLEILKQIKANSDKSISEIPVIILSNLGQESDIMRGKELGAADYLVKALITIDEVVIKVKKILGV